jgi:hypothetical protein
MWRGDKGVLRKVGPIQADMRKKFHRRQPPNLPLMARLRKRSSRLEAFERRNDYFNSWSSNYASETRGAGKIFPFEMFDLSERARVAGSCHLLLGLNATHCRRVYEQRFIAITSGGNIR